ncbi:MAG: UTP--glucose-1-phosphate uridylyltransferase GalU [Oscillospiraceae bacterium]|jgi:UTP--glucose-1-phosphate uridylyltransferase|nr:UTP--glucose-1-phosphate uridylyltransferase GalU [Oscillospiraceae bacterium]
MKIKKAVIPAAGWGTRMLPATKTIPKEMLPVVDKPIIQYNIEEIVAAGIEDILIITNRGKSAMEDYFDRSPELEDALIKTGKERELLLARDVSRLANVHFIRQQEARGLGHAIWCARRFVGDEPFAVLLGDDLMKSQTPVTAQLVKTASETGASVVGVQRVARELISKYCSLQVVPAADRLYEVKQLVEKPTPDQVFSLFAILGRYVLTPRIFALLETLPPGHGGEIQLTDAINLLCKEERVLALDFEGRRYDTGCLTGYLEANIDFALARPDIGPWLTDFLTQKTTKK